MIRLLSFVLVVFLAGCSMEAQSLSMDDMLNRKGPDIGRSTVPPAGYIVVIDMRKMCIQEKCEGITFKATKYEGRAEADWLADWESLPGVVTYKITKAQYPRYEMSVVSGGCEHNEYNCSD